MQPGEIWCDTFLSWFRTLNARMRSNHNASLGVLTFIVPALAFGETLFCRESFLHRMSTRVQ